MAKPIKILKMQRAAIQHDQPKEFYKTLKINRSFSPLDIYR